MYIYEFITPSDPITFKAENDKIAYITTVVFGDGRAGCRRRADNSKDEEDEVSLDTFMFLKKDPEKLMNEFLGCPFKEFFESHKKEIAIALKSFAYGSFDSREEFDDAVNAISDPEKLSEFLKKHEDRNRSSMSQWVLGAWKYGDKLLQNLEK